MHILVDYTVTLRIKSVNDKTRTLGINFNPFSIRRILNMIKKYPNSENEYTEGNSLRGNTTVNI